jgi:hypothetical protein
MHSLCQMAKEVAMLLLSLQLLQQQWQTGFRSTPDLAAMSTRRSWLARPKAKQTPTVSNVTMKMSTWVLFCTEQHNMTCWLNRQVPMSALT